MRFCRDPSVCFGHCHVKYLYIVCCWTCDVHKEVCLLAEETTLSVIKTVKFINMQVEEVQSRSLSRSCGLDFFFWRVLSVSWHWQVLRRPFFPAGVRCGSRMLLEGLEFISGLAGSEYTWLPPVARWRLGCSRMRHSLDDALACRFICLTRPEQSCRLLAVPAL